MYEIRSSWSSLVQLMACHLAGDRPLFEAVMTKLVGFKNIYIVFDGSQARKLLLFSVLNLFIKMCTLVKLYGQWCGVTLVVHTATEMQICCCWRCYRHQINTVVSSIRVTGSWVVYWLYCNFKLLKDGFVFFRWTNSHDCIFSDWIKDDETYLWTIEFTIIHAQGATGADSRGGGYTLICAELLEFLWWSGRWIYRYPIFK